MSLWDKFCYYGGLAGLIGIPIAIIVDIVRVGPQSWEGAIMLRGIYSIIVFGFIFHHGRKARQAAKEQEQQLTQMPSKHEEDKLSKG